MKKSFAIAAGLLGLGGCAQANRFGELALNPPLEILEALKGAVTWLVLLFGQAVVDAFMAIFGSL